MKQNERNKLEILSASPRTTIVRSCYSAQKTRMHYVYVGRIEV